MRVIVSGYLKDNFRGYKVVQSFKAVRTLDAQSIECLIIHRPLETDFEAGMFLSEFNSKGIKNFVYISSAPSMTLKMMLNGLKGTVLEDEFYFDDEEELNAVIEDLGLDDTSGNELVVSNASIISDFIKGFATGDARLQSPIYIEQVNSALNELTTLTSQQQLTIRNMGETAVSTFERATSLLNDMSTTRKNLQRQLEELEESLNNSNSSSPRSKFSSEGASFFPSYKYTGSAKVLLIRELSPCRYLTSFILGYYNHLCYQMNKRVKLIFAHQRGIGVASKYANFCTAITQESMSESSLYDAPIIATNNPKRDVLKELTHRNNEVIIVVDRLYGSQDIISSRVVKLNAVSGVTDLQRFKVQAKDCIFPITTHPQGFLTISHIKQYAQDVDTRLAMYMNTCKEHYQKLDNLLQL